MTSFAFILGVVPLVLASGAGAEMRQALGTTVFGGGAGVVLLRPLADALADGDTVYAVIKGAALGNDGAGKVSFTAPGVDGQTFTDIEAYGLERWLGEAGYTVVAKGELAPTRATLLSLPHRPSWARRQKPRAGVPRQPRAEARTAVRAAAS